KFGDQMRYVFRHLPIAGSKDAVRSAELAEYAAETKGQFWEVHEALMKRGPYFTPEDFTQIKSEFDLPIEENKEARIDAKKKLRKDVDSARESGVMLTPTFFINGRLYFGAWDESSLSDAMLGSMGHRIQSAAFNFVRWGPASGLLLGLA